MDKLEILELDHNQIEIISSDTFEDLVKLREIYISMKISWPVLF